LWFNDRVVTPARDREAIEQAVAAGSEQLKAGRLDLAQASFREALAGEPDNPRVLALLGLTYFRGGQFSDAQPIYEKLVELAATDPSHRLNLGLVYLKVNEHEKAITALEASRALDPSQGRAVNYLGLAYARAGRYAEAYRSFLIAGQNELAIEIEANLTPGERDGIHQQLGRTPQGALGSGGSSAGIAIPRTTTPQPQVARTITPPAPSAVAINVPRTETPEPRTKPPSAPPRGPTTNEFTAPQLSHPEIVIEKTQPGDTGKVQMVPARSGASIVEPSVPKPIDQASMTESMQFVLPREAAPEPVQGHSMVSQQIAVVAPSTSGTAAAKTPSGGTPPRPLSDLATDELLRPDDGTDPFEISSSGALIIRVTDRVLTRLDGVHVTGGDLQYELAMRRSRGHATEEKFDYGGTPLHAVSGHGYLVAVPGKLAFSAVTLDDDILYLREDLVFAFESTLRWESGNVPGLRGKLPVVQFRGDGSLAVRLARPLVRVKLSSSSVLFVDADRLAGWIGRVIPRAVVPPAGGPMGARCVECTGEGIVLIEPRGEGDAAVAVVAEAPPAPAIARTTTPPPPPQPADKLVVEETDAEKPAEAAPAETKPGLTGDPDLDSLADL
jgi:uncharacterized protein (AIM24 family)